MNSILSRVSLSISFTEISEFGYNFRQIIKLTLADTFRARIRFHRRKEKVDLQFVYHPWLRDCTKKLRGKC
jgi:hypothetical protein